MGPDSFSRRTVLRFACIVLTCAVQPWCGLPVSRGCTTAVISGRVTSDGRPLLWKNRDTSSTLHNEVVHIADGRYRAVAVVNAGSRSSVWMGANEAGFCIENSLSKDLASDDDSKGPGNGQFMKLALQTCATVDDFEKLLEETNVSGRSTTANFGVIDAFGGAAMFETRPNSYTLYDANDPTVAPKGYIVRSNFALTAQNLPANPAADEVAELYAGERYLRACSLIDGCPENSLSLEYVLRHMARDMAEPDGQPYCGTINGEEGTLPTVIATDRTISRTTTVSAAVFHGVRPGESPARTTMWAMLGDPKFTIALPCWVQVESIADPLTEETGGEIGEIAITLRDWNLTLERTGVLTRGLPGIWEDVWQVEDEILEETRHALDSWAARNVSISEMTEFHHAMAKKGMAAMERELAQAKQQALQPQDVQSQSPPDSSPLIQVAIYDHAEEISKGPKNLLRILTAENGFQCQRLTPSDIRGGELDKFDVLIMPGGSGSQQAEMLEESGKERVKKFVEQGGGYVGICAGSYLASSQYTWSLALVNAKVWDRAHWARGTGTVTIGFSEEGNELFDGHSNVVDVYYGQGPLLVPGEHPELPGYEVLATYRTEIAAKGAPAGAMTDTHAIVRSDFGQGRVICFSPHPETSEGPNDLITSGVLWSAGQEP